MIGFPFDSKVTYDAEGKPEYDRAITSAPYRRLLKELFKSGIMPTNSENMQVVTNSGLTVKVKAGFAMVEGLMKLEEADKTLTLDEASADYDRIDTIALRLNDTEEVRACDYVVIKGNPASSPVAPSLTRTSTIYDLGLANIRVKKNATVITTGNITDTRLDNNRCGVISSISEFDTTTLYNQVQGDLEEFKDVQEAEFIEWVHNLQDILDEHTAGHLQNEIEALDAKADIINANISSAFDSAKAYVTGDYCTDENELYKALLNSTNKKPNENPTYWELVSISAEVKQLKNDLGTKIIYREGKFINGLEVPANGSSYADGTLPTIEGYTPVAIASWYIANATTGGQNSSYCYPNQMFINSATTVRAQARNAGSSKAVIRFWFRIMYVKN